MIKIIDEKYNIITYMKYKNTGKYEKIILNKIEDLFNKNYFSEPSATFFNYLLMINEYIYGNKIGNTEYRFCFLGMYNILGNEKFDYFNLSKLKLIKIEEIKKTIPIKYSTYCYINYFNKYFES